MFNPATLIPKNSFQERKLAILVHPNTKFLTAGAFCSLY